jgi:hypothetical protein
LIPQENLFSIVIRDYAEPVIGRAFERPVGADPLAHNDGIEWDSDGETFPTCRRVGGFVGLPDAKWDERARAVIVPQEGTLLKETNFPIGPGIGWPDANAGISFFLAESEMPRKATGKIVHRDLKAWFAP